MSRPEPDLRAARREIDAAEILLRTLPAAPDVAWPHLDRAAGHLGVPCSAEARNEPRAAWRCLAELGSSLRRADRSTAINGGRLGGWVVLGLAVGALVVATMLAGAPTIDGTREVGRDAVGGDVENGPGSTSVDGGQQLVVHLGSAWNAESFGISVRHRRPCRLTLLRRGRPLWSTALTGDGGSEVHRYEVVVPDRVRRRGFEQLLFTPDPNDEDVRVGGLRLDPP